MKLRCYDKYHKMPLILDLSYEGDRINIEVTSSSYCHGRKELRFSIDEERMAQYGVTCAQDPEPERWSDLTDWEVMDGDEPAAVVA